MKVSYSCMQNMSKIYKGHNSKITKSHEKSTSAWQKENGSKSIITIKSHSITNNIHMRRHTQVMCGI